MNTIETFNKARKEHAELMEIINKSIEQPNSRYICISKVDDIYHIVGFSFSIQTCNRHRYRKSNRLAKFLGKSCEHFLDQIVEMAGVLSKKDLLDKANNARDEAKAILIMTSVKGEA